MAERLNPRLCWDALDADQQRAIGEAALLLHVSTEAQALNCENSSPSPELLRVDRRWAHAEHVAWNMLADTIPADADLFPDGPDLAAIDVRACRECGCTEGDACPGGCTWIEPDLCSACAPDTDDAPSLGPCCICEGTAGVCNIMMLDRRCAVPGHGWGCVVCDLPMDGASVVLCDPCLERYRADPSTLTIACRGYPASDGRIAIAVLPEFKHDRAKHADLDLA